MKPSWDDAPKWANWQAMDGDGWWVFYENEPEWSEQDNEWLRNGGDYRVVAERPDEDGIDWDFAYSTKERRP